MSRNIPVGQLALVIGGDFQPARVGQTCKIVEPYDWRMCSHPNGVQRLMCRYLVEFSDGEIGAYSYRNLMPFEGRKDSAEVECFELQRDSHP